MVDYNGPIPPNPFETEDEKAILNQLADWEKVTQEGALVADLMRHPGFNTFRKWLDDQAIDAKNKWLSAKDEDANKIRYQAQVYQEVANWFNSRVAKGTGASKAINDYYAEQKKLAEGFSAFQEDGGLGPIRERP